MSKPSVLKLQSIKNFITYNLSVQYNNITQLGNVAFYINDAMYNEVGRGYYSLKYDNVEMSFNEATEKVELQFSSFEAYERFNPLAWLAEVDHQIAHYYKIEQQR